MTTVDAEGKPNAIYATCTAIYGNDRIVVANSCFVKTHANILVGSKGSVLFITKEKKSYQIKGEIVYHKEGVVFDDMKQWNPTKHLGHVAAAVIGRNLLWFKEASLEFVSMEQCSEELLFNV